MSDHPAQVSITLDGRPHTLPRGRSLAAALIATDHPVTRYDRAGRPRAPYCGMGVCFDCAVTVDGTPLVRACQEPVRAGMRVDTGGGVGAGAGVEAGREVGADGGAGVGTGMEARPGVRADAGREVRADMRVDGGTEDGPDVRIGTGTGTGNEAGTGNGTRNETNAPTEIEDV
ncbi:(2Fe-2S)-binding protein [Embleya sp. NPDC008237]|uniref:(2Fe-2S)-binding protein n=1 Tax=Embleya sp. NPDC008237 TaxID=3363978 RepID=UPI0036F0F001